MVKAIKHFDIAVLTQSDFACGLGARVVGRSGSPSPTDFRGGFMLYEDREGACSGLNLEGVLHYAFVPVIDE